ncbi:MAG: SDR family NAD(P)-dependent oxidoreductase [Myxococcota bacterium]
MKRALVTGANRGLGKGTAIELARRGYHTIVTARDRASGEALVSDVNDQGYSASFCYLDVADPGSSSTVAEALSESGTGLDVAVSNAGVALDGFNEEVVKKTLAVNYYGAINVAERLLPLVAPAGRVVMVSSGMGALSAFGSDLRADFDAEDLTSEGIDLLLRRFVKAVANGTHAREGWPSSAYRVSKAALNAYVRVRAPAFLERSVLLNAVGPGWVRTDMGGIAASRSLEEGVASIVWACELDGDGPSGGFFRDGQRQPW